jgi:MFS family permease
MQRSGQNHAFSSLSSATIRLRLVVCSQMRGSIGSSPIWTWLMRQVRRRNTIPQSKVRRVEHHNHLTEHDAGTVIALYTLIGAFGALACTFLGDKVGRRWTLWISCLFNAIGAVLMCSAFSFGQFIVSRMVLGFGTGGVIATTSVWQSELSKASSRGSHVSAFGIFCGIGLVLALWIDYGCSFVNSSLSWRFPLAFPIVFSAIAMPTIFMLPESPRWLMKVGRHQEAADILSLLHSDPVDVEKELSNIRISIDLSGSASLRQLLTMGEQRIFHRMIIGSAAQMMLQLTGVCCLLLASNEYSHCLGQQHHLLRVLTLPATIRL